jgi:hypothetical protein
VRRMNRESEGKSSGIPHLAKNERDMGHPSLVREPRFLVLLLNGMLGNQRYSSYSYTVFLLLT